MKHLLLLFTFSIFHHLFVHSQEKIITGKVVSSDGSGLSNVSVLIKGTSKGTSTDKEGNYSIAVPGASGRLIFSHIGYVTQEIPLTNGTVYNLKLAKNSATLDDVVVTAAGIRRQKNTLGYSVTTLNASELAQKSEADPIRALSGKVAGLNIQGAGGVAGSSTNITIRGNSSLSNNNQPLFVVDGIPFDNSTIANAGVTTVGGVGVSSRSFDLDPNNIMSMTVLKGAAAAALYGSRAANGAIIITTKAGKKQSRKGLEISYSSSYAFEKVAGLPDYQTDYGQGTNFDYRWGVYGSWGAPFSWVNSMIPSRDSIPHPLTRQFSSAVFPQFYKADGVTPIQVPYRPYNKNNLEHFFRTGSLVENAISVSSGNEKGSLTFGLSRSTNKGIIPNNDITRTSASIGGNARLENKIYVSGSLNYVKTDQVSPPVGGSFNSGSVMATLLYLPTSYNLADFPYQNPIDGSNVYDYTGVDNPYWLTKHSLATSNVDRYYGNFVLGFDPLPWLNIQNTTGFNAYTDRRMSVRGKGSSSYINGSIETDNIYRQELDNTLMVTGTNPINKEFSLKTILGFNINQRLTQREAIYGDGIIIADINSINNTTSITPAALPYNRNYLQQRFYGFFADITMDYKKFASLNLVGRNDVSSTLPANNRSYFYGGINGSLIFTEAFQIPQTILSFGRIRAGYTRVGNEASPYQTATVFLANPTLGSIATPFTPANGSSTNTLSRSSLLANANLKPEFITELELGMELQFFHNRIGLDFTYYDKNSTSQIFTVSAAPSSGYLTQILNLGRVNNQGVEIGLNLAPLRSASGINWDISANFTRNRNVVKDLGDYKQLSYGGSNGTSSVHIVGKPYGLIQGEGYARDESGNILVNPQTGKPLAATTLLPIGNPNPDFILGLTNTLKYKNFSLQILFDWKNGGSLYSSTTGEALARGVTKDTRDREKIIVGPGILGDPNTLRPLLNGGKVIPNNVGITVADYYFNRGFGPGGIMEGSVFDATVFRLRELSIGYEIPKSFLKHTPLGSGFISISGRNLWYKAPNFPKYMNFDPEVSSLGVGNSQGYDMLAVPTTKRFGINLRFSF